MAVRSIKQLLLIAQLFDVFLEQLLVLILRFVSGINPRRPLLEVDVVRLLNTKSFWRIFILTSRRRRLRPAG